MWHGAHNSRSIKGSSLNWHTGVTTFDGALPFVTEPGLPAASIGRGEIRVAALNFASMTTTLKSGVKQPLLVDPQDADKAPVRGLTRPPSQAPTSCAS